MTGKNISLIDELEVGLEPHRIRGLIYKLKNSKQQIFATTHSPVVKESLPSLTTSFMFVSAMQRATVSLESLAVVPAIQGQVRANAEAFLGSKIVALKVSPRLVAYGLRSLSL